MDPGQAAQFSDSQFPYLEKRWQGPGSSLNTLLIAAIPDDVSEEKQRQRRHGSPTESVPATQALKDGESSLLVSVKL